MARLGMDDMDIRVATACGPGVGRFLAEALVDALQSDLHLVAVEDSADPSGDGLRGVDFVFAREDSEREEIIRVGVDQDGHVVSTELIRRVGKEGQRTAAAEEELLAAIRSGESVSALHWIDRSESRRERDTGDGLGPRRVLAITVRSDRRFQIPLGN
jgi:hypothetical protein